MVDLLETMKRQSGPYRPLETLDMNDALHIAGVLYAGEFTILAVCPSPTDSWLSWIGYCKEITSVVMTSTYTFAERRSYESLDARSPPSSRSVR